MRRRQPRRALERPDQAFSAMEAIVAPVVMAEVEVVDGMVVAPPCSLDIHQEEVAAIQRARTLST